MQVEWKAGDALDPSSYASILEGKDAVVHTLGILLEGGKYKSAVRSNSLFGVLSSLANNAGIGAAGNPLDRKTNSDGQQEGEYERINRDSGEQGQSSSYLSREFTNDIVPFDSSPRI